MMYSLWDEDGIVAEADDPHAMAIKLLVRGYDVEVDGETVHVLRTPHDEFPNHPTSASWSIGP